MFTRKDVIFMNLFVQFRAIPFHICTLLTAMLMCSMPTQAGTVFYDFAAPAILVGDFSATGFIEIDEAIPPGGAEVRADQLNGYLLSWGFTWFNGADEFSVSNLETSLTEGFGGLLFDLSSDLVAWQFCTERCDDETQNDSAHSFFALKRLADPAGRWKGTTVALASGPTFLFRDTVGGDGGQWTLRGGVAVAAPEPAVSGLLALGLLAVGATKRRKC
jgi:hypothetical protein